MERFLFPITCLAICIQVFAYLHSAAIEARFDIHGQLNDFHNLICSLVVSTGSPRLIVLAASWSI